MLKFRAILKDTGYPLKIDSDGQVEVILFVPESDALAVLPLSKMGKRVLEVAIREDGVKDDEMEKWLKG